MSYLDIPRLHFSGKFYTNPSTVDNNALNYASDGTGITLLRVTNGGAGYANPPTLTFSGGTGSGTAATAQVAGGKIVAARITSPGSGYGASDVVTVNVTPASGDVITTPAVLAAKVFDLSWNGSGFHYFVFLDCKITAAVIDPSGALKTLPSDDPAIDGKVALSSSVSAQPKLVDLDPEWQNSSQIWGMKLALSLGSEQIEGVMDTATVRDLWMARVPSPGGPIPPDLRKASGAFQSVLRNLVFTPKMGPSASISVEGFRSAGLIALRFVTYGYDLTSNTGKVVGTLGPGSPDEPTQFLKARRLEPGNNPNLVGPRIYWGPWGPAPFKLDEKRKQLVIDLGNSVPETTPGGPRFAAGPLKARVTPASGTPVDLGSFDYTQGHYETSAGVEELAVTDAQIALLKSRPLEVFLDGPPAKPVVLSERPTGTNLETAEPTLRMNPGDTHTVDLLATAFGAAKASQVVKARLTTGGARTSAGLSFTVLGGSKTDANGRVQIKFTAADPGKVRFGGKLDGQIFFVEYDWGAAATGAAPDWRGRIVVRVFDKQAAVAKPKWADVRYIFEEYARLYPGMKGILDLSDLAKVQDPANIKKIQDTLNLPETDPHFMPVSHDLSRDKRDLILRWLAAGAPA